MIDLIRPGDTIDHSGEVITASHTKRYNRGHFECDSVPDVGFRVTLTFGREA
ncbi:hypothetical protein K788_0000127 [Paraburkholderia caribensis MBA4]|uniref:Uncharacterized protein n=1 Tax=Paraburkholderia caribensis MBA4 TaxID=1323664 RepID=A0A0P0RJE3_9BURK|nr:hypothetical protein [Paraburkholderia caribensis]ALL68866.1 hypothetical protein K788_0000127 [Paraburkholderia caribensis MBA4]